MNQRIRELAVRAREQTEEFNSVRNKLTAEEWTEIYDEKFAELIVRECADIANRQFSAATGLDDRDCLTAHQMKQHFGVEE